MVHRKIGAADPTAEDYLTVIAIRGEVSPQNIDGIFKELNASQITESEASISVSNIMISDLFPSNLDYYYYKGSQTSPPCMEIVHWIVLKNKIKVPERYLESLRQIRDRYGIMLSSNFRNAHEVRGTGRTVYLFEVSYF